jgi:uncharacterized protein
MLKSTVLKQKSDKERLLALPYVARSKEKDMKKWLASDLIKVILGPRRAGKSVFALRLLQGVDFAYFNFDDESVPWQSAIDLDALMVELKSAYGDTPYILFDEIQNLPRWELFVNRLHRGGYNVVLTGSNASLLSKELVTHVTGRHIPIEILPFNFVEVVHANNYRFSSHDILVPNNKARLLSLVTEYMTNGGYPEVVVKKVEPRGYLDVLFDAVLFKDVIKRHKVRFAEQIDNLGSYLVHNFSVQYGAQRLASVLGFKSEVTLEKYMGYLNEAYLTFALKRYSRKETLRQRAPKKTYIVDNGFVTAKAVQDSPNSGKLMENLVCTELIKRGHQPNRELFYYKTRNDREVDFIRKDGYMVVELIQVCYDLSHPDTEEREVKALVEAAGELGVTKLTLITWDDAREIVEGDMRITCIPLWEWLLK